MDPEVIRVFETHRVEDVWYVYTIGAYVHKLGCNRHGIDPTCVALSDQGVFDRYSGVRAVSYDDDLGPRWAVKIRDMDKWKEVVAWAHRVTQPAEYVGQEPLVPDSNTLW